MILYTASDVERALKYDYRKKWHKNWTSIDVYRDEVVIGVKPGTLKENQEVYIEKLKALLEGHFSSEEMVIRLHYNHREMKVLFEETDDEPSESPYILPLFRSVNRMPNQELKDLAVPVYAFHSYKGGVGRTLSLIAAVQAVSNMNDGKQMKLLIVDGDLEAPGLTWIVNKQMKCDISFLDALALIHEEEEDWREVASFVAQKVQAKTITFENTTKRETVEHYFLPASREPEQLVNMPVTPQLAVQIIGREWVVSDFLASLGAKLRVDAVFMDLRAGISEISAPVLFDPRVKKVFVTTTSTQSVMGMNTLLKQIYSSPLLKKYPVPEIFLTMVPPHWNENEEVDKVEEIITELLKEVNILSEEDIANDILVPYRTLKFAQELIHLENLDMISHMFGGTPFFKKLTNVINDWFPEEKHTIVTESEQILNNLLKTTEYAEKSDRERIMVTPAIKNFSKKFKTDVPLCVIMGAKGSGKTFLYNQFIFSQTWENFQKKIEERTENFNVQTTFFLPLMKPKQSRIPEQINQLFNRVNEELGFQSNLRYFEGSVDRIQQYKKDNRYEVDWNKAWEKEILQCTGLPLDSFEGLQKYLDERNKRIVFIIDGIEDNFQEIYYDPAAKMAVRVLIQDIVNKLRSFPGGRVGLFILTRSDFALHAIEQNKGQFFSQYEPYELKWSKLEAFKLFLWLAREAGYKFNLNSIETATEEAVIEALYSLWGIKMGPVKSKEANTAKWVYAALSDFKGRLQARDVVRFLLEASHESIHKNPNETHYNDRFLQPQAIKNSIKPCAEKKIMEIEAEMPHLEEIFQKFRRSDGEHKIPFELSEYQIKTEEARLLEEQGFLLKDDNGYYLPEMIRCGLGFSNAARGRQKVLSLLERNEGR